MKRKLLVSLLVLSMVLCLLPVGVSAEGIVGTEYNTISAGPAHAAAIDSKGGLWTWGCNGVGQLGNGGVVDITDGPEAEYGYIYQSTPAKIMDDVVSVSTNEAFDLAVGPAQTSATAAIKSDGSLWVWGSAEFIGTGNKGNAENENGYAYQNVPIKLMDNVASVSMGGTYSYALKTDGTLFCWVPSGTPVKIMDNVISVSAGYHNIAVIKNDNSLWVCDDTEEFDSNWNIVLPENIKMEKVMDDVAAVDTRSYGYPAIYPPIYAAIKTDGSLWAWGTLIVNDMDRKLTSPMKLMDNALSVSVFDRVAAIKSDNSLWNFEFSYNGDAKWNEPTDPADWSFTTEKVMDGVSEVSLGPSMFNNVPNYTIVKKTDGSIWAWGYNDCYCVGNGGKGEVVKVDEWTQYIFQKTPEQIIAGGTVTPPVDQPTVIETTGANPESSGQSYANTQTILVDGKEVTFETYALHDANGYPTNYIKLRDLAQTINGTKAQFNIVWDGSVAISKGAAYQSNGSEMQTPFEGDRPYRKGADTLTIDGKPYVIQNFMLFDDNGGGYTYYKLRDIGMALGFNVGWNTQSAKAFIETDKPYTGQ